MPNLHFLQPKKEDSQLTHDLGPMTEDLGSKKERTLKVDRRSQSKDRQKIENREDTRGRPRIKKRKPRLMQEDKDQRKL